MSLFKRAFAPERRTITSLPWLQSTSTQSGEAVTDHSALRLSAVWACVTLLADLVSAMPVDVYRAGRDFTRVPVDPVGVIARPSTLGLTRREWVQQGMISLLLRGNAYGLITARDTFKRPLHVDWLWPEMVTVLHAQALDRPGYFVAGIPTPQEDLVHLRGHMMPGRVEGLSPIAYQAETIGAGLAVQKFGAQWFGQGAHPSAILSTDHVLDADGAKAMKDRFVAAIRGRREPAVLGAGITYTPIQVSPEESQFLESQQASVNAIARMYRVPAERIGGTSGGSSLTYANRDQRNLDLLSDTVNFWLCKFEDALSDMLPPGEYAKFNVDSLLRADLKTRYEAHQIAIEAGFLTIDEVREIEDMAPLAAGEDATSSPHTRAQIEAAMKAVHTLIGTGMTAVEAREFLNSAGANLDIPGPDLAAAKATVTTTVGGANGNAAGTAVRADRVRRAGAGR